MPAQAHVLYLSYDGMTDPLGRSQVLPYLAGLAGRGHGITLLSAEKPDRMAAEGAHVRSLCASAGIDWRPIRYRKRPPVISTLLDIADMYRAAVALHRRAAFDIVHCRSYIPALVGLRLKRRFAVRFVFDMRGFWADERVQGGLWDLGNPLFRTIFRYFKARERDFFAQADHVVSLTEAGRDVIAEEGHGAAGPPISVIPCCVDFANFAPIDHARRAEGRAMLDIPASARVTCYLGSVGTWYMLEEMLDCFAVQLGRDPDSRFLFITRDEPAAILAAAAARGIPEAALRIRGATREEVPQLAAAADYALFFIKPVSSKVASSPTKMGEFLSLELPMITNGGVGDVERIMAETGAGAVVEGFDADAYGRALDRIEALDPDMARWRDAARRWFSLERGIEAYDRIYRSLAPAERR